MINYKMGIDNFHTWLKSKYGNSYIRIIGNNVYDYIYIDINYILHNSMHSASTKEDFIMNMYLFLDLIFSNFIATKSITFAIDGPSPFAKMVEQRKRRFEAAKKINLNYINSLHLTPGTKFMKEIEEGINNYIKKLKNIYKIVKPEYHILSGALPDEGEIKICKKLIENNNVDQSSKHLVIGNDSDLIVICMSMINVKNINILVKAKDKNELISLDNLMKDYKINLNIQQDIAKFRSDFTLISIMMGNDYLPKLSFIKFESIWESYINYVRIYNDPIITINEDTLMHQFNIKNLKNFMQMIISRLNKNFKRIDIKNYDPESIKLYLSGLLWCINMYSTGVCPMYDYIYSGHSPQPAEILLYLCSYDDNICIPISNTPAPSIDIYTLILLPKKAKKLIPIKYHKLMDKELKYLYEQEECVECAKMSEELSKLHKELHKEQKLEQDTTNIRNNISDASKKSRGHKLTHEFNNNINLKDIRNIVNLTKNIL